MKFNEKKNEIDVAEKWKRSWKNEKDLDDVGVDVYNNPLNLVLNYSKNHVWYISRVTLCKNVQVQHTNCLNWTTVLFLCTSDVIKMHSNLNCSDQDFVLMGNAVILFALLYCSVTLLYLLSLFVYRWFFSHFFLILCAFL